MIAIVADEELGIFAFLSHSAQERVAHYRERGAHLRGMAEAEPIGGLRNKLIELAKQFEQLADRITINPRAEP